MDAKPAGMPFQDEPLMVRTQREEEAVDLAAANAELRHLDQARSLLVSLAVHELRRSLTPMRGYVEMLLDGVAGPLTDPQRKFLQSLDVGVRRVLGISATLLELIGTPPVRIELTIWPENLSSLIRAAVDEYRPAIAAKMQQVIVHAPPGLPPTPCDEVLVRQILGTLLSNASECSPPGGAITIRLAAAEEQGFLRVSLTDSGMGISPADQARLSGGAFRPGEEVTVPSNSAGLSLPMVRALVELHGGRMWSDDEPGGGSTFYVTFAAAIPADPAQPWA